MSIENIQKIIENYILSVKEKPFIKSTQKGFDKFKKFVFNWFRKTGNSLEANQKQRVLKATLVMLIQEGRLTLPVGDAYPTLKDENGNITFLPKESKEEILAIIGSDDNALKWLAEDWQAVLDNIVTPQTRHSLFRYGAGGVTAVSDPWKNFKVIYSFKDDGKEYVFLKDNNGSVCIADKNKYEADKLLVKNDPYEITAGFNEGLVSPIFAPLNPPAVAEFMTNPVKAIIDIKNEIAKAKAMNDQPALAKIYGSLLSMILLAGHSGAGFLAKNPKAMAVIDRTVCKINTSFPELVKKAGKIKDDAIIKTGESVTGDLEGLLRVLRDPQFLKSATVETPEGLHIKVPLSEMPKRTVLRMEGVFGEKPAPLSSKYQALADNILKIIEKADEDGFEIGGMQASISNECRNFVKAIREGKVEQSFLEEMLKELEPFKKYPRRIAGIVGGFASRWLLKQYRDLNGDASKTLRTDPTAELVVSPELEEVSELLKRYDEMHPDERRSAIAAKDTWLTGENLAKALAEDRSTVEKVVDIFLKSQSYHAVAELIRHVFINDYKNGSNFAVEIFGRLAERSYERALFISLVYQDNNFMIILNKTSKTFPKLNLKQKIMGDIKLMDPNRYSIFVETELLNLETEGEF